MADGGWVRLEENVNYNTVYGECSYTGRSISRNGITYTAATTAGAVQAVGSRTA